MLNPVLLLVSLVTRQLRAQFIRKTRRVAAVQDQFLLDLLRVQESTELGQRLGLSRITTIDQFRAQVPIWPYSEYGPYLERVAQGEQNVVTADPLLALNVTSGTTGNRKFIAVTQRSQRLQNRTNQVAMGFALELARQQQRPLGQLLITTAAITTGVTEGGIPYGHVSSSGLRLSDRIYRYVFSQPYAALKIPDPVARHYVCLLFAMGNPNTALIGATFPVLMLQLCEYLDKFRDRLLDDLETGTLPTDLDIPTDLRTTLQRQLRPQPERAAALRDILHHTGTLTPRQIWPNLAFLITAKGGTSNFYFQRFADYFGDLPIFGGTYASAEATFGVHWHFDSEGTILAIDNGFFEFIPRDQWQAETPKTLLATEVQVGEFYRVLVTNYAGFYRYDLGDVVEVVGFYEQAPLIVFRYRQGGTLSATTEKTSEYHAVRALQTAQQTCGVQLEDFCITLSDQLAFAHYIINIEVAAGSVLTDPTTFLAVCDRALQDENLNYAEKRQSGEVGHPQLRILAPGSFATLYARQLKPGMTEAQLKFPHINSDRAFMDGITVEQDISL
jgi:hypothetical protein